MRLAAADGMRSTLARADRATSTALGRARAGAATYPRHLALGLLVIGLLCGPRWPAAIAVLAVATMALLARSGALALVALVALLLGAAIADARLQALDRTALTSLMHRAATWRVTLLDHPRMRAFAVHVAPVRLRGERVLLRVPSRVRWPARAAPGNELLVAGELERLDPREAAERRRGAHALLRAGAIELTGRRRGGVLGALDGIRTRTERALTTGLPPPQGGLARGMVLGQDSALSAGVRDDFRTTGLAHLVAASGANVLLLATLVLAVASLAGLGLTARLLVALAFVAAYVPLAGAGPSIQRAGVMGAAGLLAVMAGRPASRWYALLLAAAVTLVANPRAAEDPGWQLSFAAVVAILALVPALRARLRRARVPRALGEAIAITTAATIATAPLIALHFERVSLVSLPANLLALPAVAPVMWLGTIAGALGQVVPGLAQPVAALAAFPLGYLTWLAERGAALPFAELEIASPGPAGVVLVYAVAALALAVWAHRRAHRAAHAAAQGGPRAAARRGGRATAAVGAAVAVTLGVIALARSRAGPAAPRELTVSFLDVGQGDATLIQHGAAAVLVDTGPPGGPILDRLREAGVRALDVLVCTHDASDHSGAAGDVLDAVPVGLVLDGEERTPQAGVVRLARRRSVRWLASDAGQTLRVGPLQLRVLWPSRAPPAPAGAEPNDRATVLHVRDGEFDMLLTADAESDVLAALDLPAVDVLKVAHHGSDDPGLPALLRRLAPRVAVIPVGRRNSYGHPSPSTLTALASVPIVRRTDADGTVRIRAGDGRMSVSTRE